MEKPKSTSPFKPLGRQLKALREGVSETLAEASGAVEIDVRVLAGFELGQHRPSEDLLLLLISHFGVRDDEALKLWELAGYNLEKIPAAHMANDEVPPPVADQPQLEQRILFTDVVDVMVNNYGVVIHFMQGSGPGNPPTIVSRVGMSREHAKSVLNILQETLRQTERQTGSLSMPKSTPDDKTKS